jgi:radical SAM protein with 4Fe4S-binding SPASM domain
MAEVQGGVVPDARARPVPGAVDLDRRPVVIAWEVTRACPYRCDHCRADAQTKPAPGELDSREAEALVDALQGFAGSTLVLTGGDPLLRRDLEGLVRRAVDRGLSVALTPSATPLVTPERLDALRRAGVRQVALSLDGADAETHDGLRRLRGSFDRTVGLIHAAAELGCAVQVNTTVTRRNVDQLERVAALVGDAGVVMWSAFFLVPVGRARTEDMLSPDEHEAAFHRLADIAAGVSFRVKVTEAPAYRRVLLQRGAGRAALPPPVNDGRGFMFVSHDGQVCPSGFLPYSAGNVREHSPVDLYRDAEVFRRLRDPSRLEGRCGRCEFRDVCGGSRARAWAITGNAFAEDPSCIHMPAREG